MKVTKFTSNCLAYRREAKRMEAMGYKQYRPGQVLRENQFRDAKPSFDGESLWILAT